jgi:hypothetical protein
MPHREWPGEEPERRHGVIKVAARNGKRSHQRATRIRELRIRNLLPSDLAGLHEDELAHRRPE